MCALTAMSVWDAVTSRPISRLDTPTLVDAAAKRAGRLPAERVDRESGDQRRHVPAISNIERVGQLRQTGPIPLARRLGAFSEAPNP